MVNSDEQCLELQRGREQGVYCNTLEVCLIVTDCTGKLFRWVWYDCAVVRRKGGVVGKKGTTRHASEGTIQVCVDMLVLPLPLGNVV